MYIVLRGKIKEAFVDAFVDLSKKNVCGKFADVSRTLAFDI